MTKNSYKGSTVKNMKELGFNYDKRVESDNPFKNSADASKNVARVGKPIIVKDNNHKSVGVISQSDLLKAVIEGSDGE